MELDVCPINNHFSGSIVSFTVAPTSGPQGTTFTFSITYTTLNNSGTADLAIVIEPSDAEAFGDDTLFIGEDAGTYQTQFSLQAVPNESEPFNPGVYQTVTGKICKIARLTLKRCARETAVVLTATALLSLPRPLSSPSLINLFPIKG